MLFFLFSLVLSIVVAALVLSMKIHHERLSNKKAGAGVRSQAGPE